LLLPVTNKYASQDAVASHSTSSATTAATSCRRDRDMGGAARSRSDERLPNGAGVSLSKRKAPLFLQ
jgi:hypothetical protein